MERERTNEPAKEKEESRGEERRGEKKKVSEAGKRLALSSSLSLSQSSSFLEKEALFVVVVVVSLAKRKLLLLVAAFFHPILPPFFPLLRITTFDLKCPPFSFSLPPAPLPLCRVAAPRVPTITIGDPVQASEFIVVI